MKINFDEIKETVISQFRGGKKNTAAKIFADENNKIMYGSLEQGASIGMHTHDTSSEIIYILSGNAEILFDNDKENLSAGECHYCPKGHSHSLINAGSDNLIFFAVVPEHSSSK